MPAGVMKFQRWRLVFAACCLIAALGVISLHRASLWAVITALLAINGAKNFASRRKRKRPRLKTLSEQTRYRSGINVVDRLVVMHDWGAKNAVNQSKLSRILESGSISKSMKVEELYTEKIVQLLKSINVYNFPVFSLSSESGNKPLFIMLHYLSVSSGLIFKVGISEKKFLNFTRAVELGYRKKVPFHNSTHAADVLHCLYYFLQSPVLTGVFSCIEILSMYIAAAVHDLDHPGTDNDFLSASGHSFALKYNDHSVLENHHCYSAFCLMKIPECNFVDSLSRSEYVCMRRMIVEMVLATDPNMRLQNFLYNEFKSKLDNTTAGPFNPKKNSEDKLILARSLIRLADISNTTKNWFLYRKWTKLLSLEQKRQMYLERAIDCRDPQNNAKSKLKLSTQNASQKNFVQYVVSPMAFALCGYLELQEVLFGIKKNLNILEYMDQDEELRANAEKRKEIPEMETYYVTKVLGNRNIKKLSCTIPTAQESPQTPLLPSYEETSISDFLKTSSSSSQSTESTESDPHPKGARSPILSSGSSVPSHILESVCKSHLEIGYLAGRRRLSWTTGDLNDQATRDKTTSTSALSTQISPGFYASSSGIARRRYSTGIMSRP